MNANAGPGFSTRKPAAKFKLTRFNAVLMSTTAAYLVRGLIPRGGMVVIWGPPKCGKSFLTFDMVMHVVRGVFYRGRRVKQGAVVYLALEGGIGFHNRVEAYRRTHDVTDGPFYLITDRTDLVKDHQALIAAIREQVGDEVPVILVLDTLNRSLAGSESKDEDMALYIQAADAVRQAFNCAVLIVHHCGVDGSRPRGHTSLTGAVDAQIAVMRDPENNIIATVEWMKDGTEGDVIASRLEVVDLGPDDDGEPITSCVIRPVEAQPPRQQPEKRKREPKSTQEFRAAFTEALNTAGKMIAAGDSLVRAVNVEIVRAQFMIRWATGETDPDKRADAQRKAFERAMKNRPAEFSTLVRDSVEWIWTAT
jgi:KaiC/GvpD/RAD55 family RecA-like ATPase